MENGPQTFLDLRAVTRAIPNPESLSRLELSGVRYIVGDERRLAAEQLTWVGDWSSRLPLRYVDAVCHVRVHELLPRGSSTP